MNEQEIYSRTQQTFTRVFGREISFRPDLARGDEGWRLLLRLTEPINLARITRRTAAVPFVP